MSFNAGLETPVDNKSAKHNENIFVFLLYLNNHNNQNLIYDNPQRTLKLNYLLHLIICLENSSSFPSGERSACF